MSSLASMGATISQTFPGKPTFTEKELPDLSGKIYIVTGSNTGIGKDLAEMLYSKNAKVYLAARSESKTKAAIDDIKATCPESKGEMVFLQLDLADLSTIKATAQAFLSKEERLDVLWNNAGVGFPDASAKTAQGYDLQLGVNCLGPWLFTHFLNPILAKTAKSAPSGTVRVVWVSSSAAYAPSPRDFTTAIDYENKDKRIPDKYFLSKLGNYYQSTEYARLHKADGVISNALNPGNLDSDFWRNTPALMRTFLRTFILYPSRFGGYTLLFAGLSPKVTLKESGKFVAPWGRLVDMPSELAKSAQSASEGGYGEAEKFREWTEAQLKPYF